VLQSIPLFSISFHWKQTHAKKSYQIVNGSIHVATIHTLITPWHCRSGLRGRRWLCILPLRVRIDLLTTNDFDQNNKHTIQTMNIQTILFQGLHPSIRSPCVDSFWALQIECQSTEELERTWHQNFKPRAGKKSDIIRHNVT
jgi:hypothetical protein